MASVDATTRGTRSRELEQKHRRTATRAQRGTRKRRADPLRFRLIWPLTVAFLFFLGLQPRFGDDHYGAAVVLYPFFWTAGSELMLLISTPLACGLLGWLADGRARSWPSFFLYWTNIILLGAIVLRAQGIPHASRHGDPLWWTVIVPSFYGLILLFALAPAPLARLLGIERKKA